MLDTPAAVIEDRAVAPLRERNFALLFAARTISFFGANLVPIALAFAVLDACCS
jgi:hypothetical protein